MNLKNASNSGQSHSGKSEKSKEPEVVDNGGSSGAEPQPETKGPGRPPLNSYQSFLRHAPLPAIRMLVILAGKHEQWAPFYKVPNEYQKDGTLYAGRYNEESESYIIDMEPQRAERHTCEHNIKFIPSKIVELDNRIKMCDEFLAEVGEEAGKGYAQKKTDYEAEREEQVEKLAASEADLATLPVPTTWTILRSDLDKAY